MANVELIPVDSRLCDLCNDCVTDQVHLVTKSFVLTDWGVICVECWDRRSTRPDEFLVEKVYIKFEKIEDEWIWRPLVFTSCREGRG